MSSFPVESPRADLLYTQLQGASSGQIVVGNNNLLIGSVHGALVKVLPPDQVPQPALKTTPILLRPRSIPGFLNRNSEVAACISAISAGEPVNLFGEKGFGKFSLLSRLAYHNSTSMFRDGVIHHSARGMPATDILQSIYDAFYDCAVPYIPTATQLRVALGKRRALILLDDIDLSRDGLNGVLSSATGCEFVVTSTDRLMWHSGRSMLISGLRADHGLTLVQRELGRALGQDERRAFIELNYAVEGHPLKLLQLAALARDEERSFTEVAKEVLAEPSGQHAPYFIGHRPERERRVLAAIAALDGVPFHASHLPAITGLDDVRSELERLVQLRLIESEDEGFFAPSITSQVVPDVEQQIMVDRHLAYFTSLSTMSQGRQKLLYRDSAAVLKLMTWAVDRERWEQVVRLAQAVEETLVLSARWGSWDRVLAWTLLASRKLGDRRIEARVLHQIGSRAFCLGERDLALRLFNDALRIRRSIGDTIGSEVTQHNLNAMRATPFIEAGSPDTNANGRTGLGAAASSVLLAGLIIGALWLIYLAAWSSDEGEATGNESEPTSAAVVRGDDTDDVTDVSQGAMLPAPSVLRASVTDGRGSVVELSWQYHGDEAEGFYVERKVGTESFERLTAVSPETTSVRDETIEPQLTYSFRVQAYSGDRTSDFSNEAIIVSPSSLHSYSSDRAHRSGAND